MLLDPESDHHRIEFRAADRQIAVGLQQTRPLRSRRDVGVVDKEAGASVHAVKRRMRTVASEQFGDIGAQVFGIAVMVRLDMEADLHAVLRRLVEKHGQGRRSEIAVAPPRHDRDADPRLGHHLHMARDGRRIGTAVVFQFGVEIGRDVIHAGNVIGRTVVAVVPDHTVAPVDLLAVDLGISVPVVIESENPLIGFSGGAAFRGAASRTPQQRRSGKQHRRQFVFHKYVLFSVDSVGTGTGAACGYPHTALFPFSGPEQFIFP